MKKIGIIGGGLAPYFNDAVANQMYLLSRKLNAQVITCNDIGLLPFKKMGQYLIVNTKFIMNETPFLSFINGVVLYATIKLYERNFDVIIIPGGIDSKFLNYLDLKKCIPIVTSIPFVNECVGNKIKKIALELQGIIAQSKRTKNQLVSMGVNPSKITLIYPLIDLSKFKYSDPPPLSKFKILFASAPNFEVSGEDNFGDKGVPLLLEVFKDFIKEGDAVLYIIWRGGYNRELYQMINRLDLEDYVEVIDKVVDMPEMYAKTHITVIPFLNLWRSPEIPLSAVESLACGRPVVATDVGEIAELVQKYKCGCATKPDKEDFLLSLIECKNNYQSYQTGCFEAICELSNLEPLEKNLKFIKDADYGK
jgi:glycosyltransferase involved in cell wall biosynthesis